MLKSLLVYFEYSNKRKDLFCRTSIETDLRVEKDFRQRLQQTLTSEKEKVSSLQFDIHELNLIKQVNNSVLFFLMNF
jgi:hypothetical protein